MSSYYYRDPKAPSPTRLHIGTAIAIYRDGLLLLDHRRDGGWGLIGGALELGESLEQCARREAMEETGLDIGVLSLLGVFSHPSRIIQYPDGDAVQSVTVCFAAEAVAGAIRISEESRDVRFVTRDELLRLPVVQTHQMIVPYLFKRGSWPVIQ